MNGGKHIKMKNKYRGMKVASVSFSHIRNNNINMTTLPTGEERESLLEKVAPEEFKECDTCIVKPGSPQLCSGCFHNRTIIDAYNQKITQTKEKTVRESFKDIMIKLHYSYSEPYDLKVAMEDAMKIYDKAKQESREEIFDNQFTYLDKFIDNMLKALNEKDSVRGDEYSTDYQHGVVRGLVLSARYLEQLKNKS